MRTLFWQISTTLDGYMEGPNGELDDTAQFPDEDFERYAADMLQSIDAVVLGRKTYDLFSRYWPTATGPDADRLNQLPKLVFSRTLDRLDWRNARLGGEDVAGEIAALKLLPGRDIALFGSAELAGTLSRLGLIDEYRILVTPRVLGGGTPALRAGDRLGLTLTDARTWRSGTLALFYRPA